MTKCSIKRNQGMRAIQNNSKNASNIDDGLRSLGWVCLARLLIQQMTGNMLADWWAIWQSREMSIEWMVDENWARAQSWERRRVWECVRGREGILTVWERGGTGGAGYTEREGQRGPTSQPLTPSYTRRLSHKLLHLVRDDVKKGMQFLYTPASPSSLLLLWGK